MKNPFHIKYSLMLGTLLASAATSFAGTAGSWIQAVGGNQDWGNTGNWSGGIMADGVDANAIFNVNLTADQTLTNVYNRTVGNLFFQDSDTATAGGFGFANETAFGAFTLDVSAGRSIVDVGALNTAGGKKISVSLPLVNSKGILKINTGQLSLRANSTNLVGDYLATSGLTDTRSFVFLTNIVVTGGGQFQVDFGNASAANLSNLVLSTTPVTLGANVLVPLTVIPPILPLSLNNLVNGGGTLTISGRATSTNAQTFGGITFNRGSSTITVTAGGNPSMIVVNPTTFTRNAGAVVNFNTPGSATNILYAGGLSNDAGGIIGGWALDGSGWAVVNAANALAPLTNYEARLDPTLWTSTTNVSLSTNALSALGSRTINTLRLTGFSTNSIGVGNTLTLADGGLMTTAGISQFPDGTIQGPPGGELNIYVATTNFMAAVLADNTSPSTLLKSGGGILVLSGTNANTYSSGTYVNQGILQVGDGASGGNNLSLGTGPVSLCGGTLQVNRTNDTAIANSISGSGLLVKQGVSTLTLSGNNTYSGFNQSAPGGNAASGSGGGLGFPGTRLDAGTLAVASDTAIGGVLRFNGVGTTLRSADGATRTLPNALDIAVNGTVFGSATSGNLIITGTVDTGGGAKNFIISNAVTRFDGLLKGTGTTPITHSGPGTLVLTTTTNPTTRPWVLTGGTLEISDPGCLGTITAANSAQLQLNGGALRTTANVSFSDNLRGITLQANGGTFNVDAGTTLGVGLAFSANAITGTGGLTKTGAGTLEIGSASSYSGVTVVNNGTLKLDASGSINSSSSIVLGSAATLDVTAFAPFTLQAGQSLIGGGTVLGNVAGSSASLVSAGLTVPGTLTFSNDLTLQTGDTLTFALTNNTTIGGGVNDLIVVHGNLNLNGNVVTIRALAAGGALANGTYRLITYTGTKTGTLTVSGGSRFTMTIDDTIPGQINLVVSGLPASLKWAGADYASWDVATSPNWLNGASPDVFFDFDSVLFDGTSPGSNVVIASTVVQPTVLTVNASTDYSITGGGALNVLSDLDKGGAGKLTLGNSAAVTVGGLVSITNGTLLIASASFTSGPIRNQGTLAVASSGFASGPVQNDGTLRFQNSGGSAAVTNLSGAGPVYVESLYQDAVLAGDNTGFSGSATVSPNSRLALYPDAGSTINSLGASPGVTVQDLGALYVTVPGTFAHPLTLSGPGFSGDTLGALRAGNIALTWLGPITLASDATIGNDGGTLTLGNLISGGTFALTKSGSGTVVLRTNASYGATTINAGNLQVGAGGTSGTLGAGPVTNSAVLTFNRTDTFTVSNSITGTGGLEKTGSGTLILSGTNSYDGTTSGFAAGAAGTPGTRLTTGTLALGSDSAMGVGIFRANTAGVTIRAADATTRIIPNTVDTANDFIIGSADTGDLIWTGTNNTGGAAKTLTINNKVTTFGSVVTGGPSANNLTKAGPGTLIFSGANTYQRPTVVSAGSLLVNGFNASLSNLTVSAGILGGTGVISGPVSVAAAGSLAPGASGIGTLSISNTLTLAGTNYMELSKAAATCDLVQGLTSLTYGGRLVVTNLGGTLAVGDSFKLFESAAYAGAFASVSPAAPGAGLLWDTNSLILDGTLKIVQGIPTTPTNIVWGVTADGLQLQWPADYTGWRLLVQTNNLATGISAIATDWETYPGSAATNSVTIPIDVTKPTEFYRLVFP